MKCEKCNIKMIKNKFIQKGELIFEYICPDCNTHIITGD